MPKTIKIILLVTLLAIACVAGYRVIRHNDTVNNPKPNQVEPVMATSRLVCGHYEDSSPGPAVYTMFLSVSIKEDVGGIIGPTTMDQVANPPAEALSAFEKAIELPTNHRLEASVFGWREGEQRQYFPFDTDINPPPSPQHTRLWFSDGPCGASTVPIFDSANPSAQTLGPYADNYYTWLWELAAHPLLPL